MTDKMPDFDTHDIAVQKDRAKHWAKFYRRVIIKCVRGNTTRTDAHHAAAAVADRALQGMIDRGLV